LTQPNNALERDARYAPLAPLSVQPLSLWKKSISRESGELEENATSQDALYTTISCWGEVKSPPKIIP
jgi:hypothetical protein